MQARKDVRFSDDLINLTDRVIHLYDQGNGEIVSFQPDSRQLPDFPAVVESGASVVHYIVDEYNFNRLQERGRNCTDIAVFDHEDHGRQGILVATLYWGADPEIKIWLRRHNCSY